MTLASCLENPGLTSGGTINGDLVITGDLTVQQDLTVQLNTELTGGTLTIDVDDNEAVLVRKDGDAGDVLTVNTNAPSMTVGAAATATAFTVFGNTTVTRTNAVAFVVEDASNNDVFAVDTNTPSVAIAGGAAGTAFGTFAGNGTGGSRLTLAGGTWTAGGTDDGPLSITATLNDSGAAGGSDVFRAIDINVTQADATGWDAVYGLDIRQAGTSKARITSDGFLYAQRFYPLDNPAILYNGTILLTNTSGTLQATACGELYIGSNIDDAGGGISSLLQVHGSGTAAGLGAVAWSADTDGPVISMTKSRGATGSHTVITTGDTLGGIRVYGDDGTDLAHESGRLEWVSTGTVGSNRIPSYCSLSVSTDAAPSVLTEILRMYSGNSYFYSGLFANGLHMGTGTNEKAAILNEVMTATNPGFSTYGNRNTGLSITYNATEANAYVSAIVNSTEIARFTASNLMMGGGLAGYPRLQHEAASATNPVVTLGNNGTGIGGAYNATEANAYVSAIVNSTEIARFTSGGIELKPATGQLLLPLQNDAATPTLAFGDGDSGFYETSDDTITVAIQGSLRGGWDGYGIWTSNGSNGVPYIQHETAAATNPVYSFVGIRNTGIGGAYNATEANAYLSAIINSTEIARFKAGGMNLAAGNLEINTPTANGNLANGMILKSGTAASAAVTDGVQLWAADAGGLAGHSALHIRGEDDASNCLVVQYKEESADAETPQAAATPGTICKFTDSGDGSGDGTYQLALDGTTWNQLA